MQIYKLKKKIIYSSVLIIITILSLVAFIVVGDNRNDTQNIGNIDIKDKQENKAKNNSKIIKKPILSESKFSDLMNKYYSEDAIIHEFNESKKLSESENGLKSDRKSVDTEKSFEYLKNKILTNTKKAKNALSAIGLTRNPNAIPLLIPAIRDKNLKKYAKEGLIRMGYMTTDALLTHLDSQETSFVEEVFDILGKVGDPKAILPIYKQLMESENKEIRRSAAEALTRFENRAALRAYFYYMIKGITSSSGIYHDQFLIPDYPITTNKMAADEILIFTKTLTAYYEHIDRSLKYLISKAKEHKELAIKYQEKEEFEKMGNHNELRMDTLGKSSSVRVEKSRIYHIIKSIVSMITMSNQEGFSTTLEFISDHYLLRERLAKYVAKAYGSLNNFEKKDALIKLLESSDEEVVVETIDTLSKSPSREPIPHLLDFIGHENVDISRSAQKAIIDIIDEETIYESLISYSEKIIKKDAKESLRVVAEKIFLLYSNELDSVLKYGNESQRMTFAERFRGNKHPYSILMATEDAEMIFKSVLRIKGIILDSLIEDRKLRNSLNDPRVNKLSKSLISKRNEYQQLSKYSKNEEKRKELNKEIASIENQINRLVSQYGQSRRSKTIKVMDLINVMDTNTLALEFVKYPKFEENKWDEHYGVIVLGKDEDEPVLEWVELGNSESIDKLLVLYKASIENKIHRKIEELSNSLHDVIWAPIQHAIGKEVDKIYVAPDSTLNVVNFATLSNKKQLLLGELYTFIYISSLRDLIKESNEPKITNKIVTFYNPDFQSSRNSDSTKSSGDAMNKVNSDLTRTIDLRKVRNLNLASLPGTIHESKILRETGSKHGFAVHEFGGERATESNFRENNQFSIIHLATHGFFLPPLNEESFGFDPMLRSGFALSGANQTLKMWGNGDFPTPENDGVVTAAEISLLDFAESSVIVLSACDTGIGDIVDGEGVFGLRRGFAYAGTQNLVITLWPISDKYTAKFMDDFYENLISLKLTPARALAKVQREHLKKFKEKSSLAEAIIFAGPFILNSNAPDLLTN